MRPGSNSLDKLRELLSGLPAVAMQFSPNSMIFTVSTADAGTIDLIRSFGVNVISSANLVARFEATWTEEQILLHLALGKSIDSIRQRSFQKRQTRSKRRHE
jgi:Xaa-Pro dipeptidase